MKRNSVNSVGTISQQSVAQTWAACIKGDPVTKRGKRIQKIKVLFFTLLPTLFLVSQNISSVVVSINHVDEDETLRKEILFSAEAGIVMYHLQGERGRTVQYVSSGGDPSIREDLLDAYRKTDESVDNLTRWIPPAIDGKPYLVSKESLSNFLREHRAQLRYNSTTVEEEIAFYSGIVMDMIGWVSSSVHDAPIGYIWKSRVAYHMSLLSKEQAGVERALGGIFYVRGELSDDHHRLFVRKYNYRTTYIQRCLQYSTSICRQDYEKAYKNTDLEDHVNSMAREILDNNFTNPSLNVSNLWFDAMTKYMDILKEIEEKLIKFLIRAIDKDEQDSMSSVTLNVIILVLVTLLAPVTVLFVFSIIADIQVFATVLKNKSNELEVEKTQSTRLLYQMLPRQIADRLRRREVVQPESYDMVTVFFSDIVGFSEFATECAPLQIVDILNNLYKIFDVKIDYYDAFQVQTIGDAYMVVSGCPEKNQDSHAKEIGLMALDLLYALQNSSMPYLIEGEKMKIRVGIHSGSCVAGVVGYTMPRYCLFGDTVYTASRIASASLGKGTLENVLVGWGSG